MLHIATQCNLFDAMLLVFLNDVISNLFLVVNTGHLRINVGGNGHLRFDATRLVKFYQLFEACCKLRRGDDEQLVIIAAAIDRWISGNGFLVLHQRLQPRLNG